MRTSEQTKYDTKRLKTPRELVVGVLGGMGPEATVDFMQKVIAATPAQKDQDHISLLVHQNPKVPNRRDAIFCEGEDPGPALATMASDLERAGADFLVMPCNAAHVFESQIIKAIAIPLLSIVQVSVSAALAHGNGCVGVMATDGCLKSGIYQSALRNRGVDCTIPEDDNIDELMGLINLIKAGHQSVEIKSKMKCIAEKLILRGASIVIAGCTEIPLVLQSNELEVPLISSTDELATATVDVALGTSELPSIAK